MAGEDMDNSSTEAAGFSNGTAVPGAVSATLLVFGVPLALTIVVTNCLLFVVLKKCKESPFRGSTTAVLVSLAACDILAGLVLLVNLTLLALPHSVFGGASVYWCKLWAVLQAVPMMTDVIHLVAISGERNQTISHPARQPKAETMRLVALGVWGLPVGLAALAFAFPFSSSRSGFCDIADLAPLYFIIVVFLVVMLGSVFVSVYYLHNIKGTLKVHQRKIQVTNTITYENLLDDTASAKLFFVIYALTIVAWLPLVITIIVSYAKVNTIDSAVRFVFLFGHVAFLKVPMIICGSQNFRSKFVDTFKRKPQSFVSPR